MNDLLIKLLELFCQIAGKIRDANEKSFKNILKVQKTSFKQLNMVYLQF